MKLNLALKAALPAALWVAASAHAAPPANSPYATDPVNEYVQDDTAQGISSMNMVLCVIGSMDPGDMVNAGPYLALVDMNKCQNKGGGGAGAAGATNYANAVVNVTRASNSDPMIARVWLSLTEQGEATRVFAYLTATQSPSSAPPYGVFRMDYIGEKGGQVGFNGYVNAQPGTITFLETGANSSNTALAMAATSTTAGGGTMQLSNNGGSSTFNFAYDPSYFRRADAASDQCFDRSKANAAISVWQYGTYKASDGTRVDLQNPGFPIQASYLGATYYGFDNFYGINFQGLDLNTLADASPVPGLTITDQRPGNTATYRLGKVGGKLTKWAQVHATLGDLDGIPFSFGADLHLHTSPAVAGGWNNWVVQWSTANNAFTVIGQQVCGSNGCQSSPVAASVIDAGYLSTNPIAGWADTFGGNLSIPATNATHVAADAIYYYTQSTVVPGSAGEPTALYCLSQCPTAAQLTTFAAGTSTTTPFGNGTDQQWFSAAGSSNTVTYVFGANGLQESGTPMVLEHASQYPSGSQFAQNGLQTGRLFDVALGTVCPAGYPGGTICEPASPAVYYTWQTGTNQWSQSLWLTRTADASIVALDAPENIAYTVPIGAAYGSWAGKSILLQFSGFGNLYGVPGYCVSSVDNSVVDCRVQDSRYVSSFAIPDGALMTLPSPSTPLIVKALNAEIRLKNLGAGAAQCAALPLTPLTLPSGGTHDPSSATDSEYLGVMPVVTAAPKVIDGVLQ